MAHLIHRDIQILQDCIREIYADLEPDEWHSRLLAVISKAITSNHISYNKIDLVEQKVIYLQRPFLAVSQKDIPAYEKYMHEHPYINILYPARTKRYTFKKSMEGKILSDVIRNPVGRVLKISDMLTDNQFRSLALYNEFYRKYDVDYQMCLPLSYRPDTGAGEAIAVSRKGKDFSERDRLMLSLLSSHIIQAYKNADLHGKARKASAVLESSNLSIKTYGLTGREEETLYWVSQGKTNAEVAWILKMASGTVKRHLENIYQKLGVENRTAAAMLAMATPGIVKTGQPRVLSTLTQT